VRAEPKKKRIFEPIKPVLKPKEKTRTARAITVPTAKGPTEIETKAPATTSHVLSLGLKGGMIFPPDPWRKNRPGGHTYVVSLDMRYILPVFDERLTLGVEAGFIDWHLDVTNTSQTFDTMVFPISLNLFYRFPLYTLFQIFVGAGGDVLVCTGEKTTATSKEEYTNIVYGGHVSAGVESELGPGFAILEGRAGITLGDTGLGEDVNMNGISVMAGYRFVF
jgi:hypothetical protein